MTRYSKTIAAFLMAVGTWGATAWGNDSAITGDEYFGLLIALAGALAVYQIPNTPPPGEPSDPNMSEQDA